MHPRAGFSKPPWDVGIGHRKNRTGGNSPNHARAKATPSSTGWFELGVSFPRIRLGVALRRLVLRTTGISARTPRFSQLHYGGGKNPKKFSATRKTNTTQRTARNQSPGSIFFAWLPVSVDSAKPARGSVALVDLSRISSGTFFREVHPGSEEMASQNDQNKAK